MIILGKYYSPVHFGAKIKTDEKLKCILFSHGLGAYRSFYNCICTELASRGYLVGVLEHRWIFNKQYEKNSRIETDFFRDFSSCCTYYYKSKEDAVIDNRTLVPFKKIDFGKDHYSKRNEQVMIYFINIKRTNRNNS